MLHREAEEVLHKTAHHKYPRWCVCCCEGVCGCDGVGVGVTVGVGVRVSGCAGVEAGVGV